MSISDKELQWLLSLSAISYAGPVADLEALTNKGFYKKGGGILNLLDKDILVHREPYIKCKPAIEGMQEDLDIHDRNSFYAALDAMVEGWDFAADMHQMMVLGRTLDGRNRDRKRSFLINGHPYLYELFKEVMKYEFHWPKQGLLAYEIANGVMLGRLGVSMGFMDEDIQQDYFDKLFEKVKDNYKGYRTFGTDAAIGRHIHIRHLEIISNTKVSTDKRHVLSKAYYGIWQYLEALFMLG